MLGAPSGSWFGVAEGPTARESYGFVRLLWTRDLNGTRGAYVPVEPGGPAFDLSVGRILVGSTYGRLRGFDLTGREMFRYEAGTAIEATPAIDVERGEVYIASGEGKVHALYVRTGEVRFTVDLEHPIRQAPVLTDDAVYVVTENDRVIAVAREDGTRLWSYRRPPAADFAVAGHGGLAIAEGRVFAGFSDGFVAGLDATDGAVIWEIDTANDLGALPDDAPTFQDVDTTPVVVDGTAYVASFAGGLYAMSTRNGTVAWREPEWTGITQITAVGDWLLLGSADFGIRAVERESREVVWERPLERGAPSPIRVAEGPGLVFYGESRGSFVVARIHDGEEVARLESGFGFSGPAAISDAGDLVSVMSNSGRLFTLRVHVPD